MVVRNGLLSIAALAERLHRRALDLLDGKLVQLGYVDLNATQAMILLHMGTERMSPSDLMSRGCYQGTNVTYNLKKLTMSGYIAQERSDHDRRVVNIRATRKGRQLLKDLEQFYVALDQAFLDACRLDASTYAAKLADLDRFMASYGSSSSNLDQAGYLTDQEDNERRALSPEDAPRTVRGVLRASP
jgi:DNA-binding MarR family transcriptional regulator